jgi:hypothetical protein
MEGDEEVEFISVKRVFDVIDVTDDVNTTTTTPTAKPVCDRVLRNASERKRTKREMPGEDDENVKYMVLSR